jgi:methionine synthase I (cobalamin-dependent)
MDLSARMKGSSPPLLWDGGVGTSLISRGLDLRLEPPEAWLVRRPEEVQAVHAAFAAAGADALQTNTFGLPRLLLAQGAERPAWLEPAALIRQAVALLRAAAPAAIAVASLGPSGLDRPDPGQVQATIAELAGLFAAQGVAAIHLETCCLPAELQAAVRGVREAAPGLTLLVSLTLSPGERGLQTPLSVPLGAMLKTMEREMPDAVGVNCSLPARRMGGAVEALRRWMEGRLPILAQPQVDPDGPECRGRRQPETGPRFAQGLLDLLAAGADAVGGCCGCAAEHLAAARCALDAMARATTIEEGR